jgi:hypothetical protein
MDGRVMGERSDATPFFERLCPAMTMGKIGAKASPSLRGAQATKQSSESSICGTISGLLRCARNDEGRSSGGT